MTGPSLSGPVAVISDGSALSEETQLEPVLSAHARRLEVAGFCATTAALTADDLADPPSTLRARCGDSPVFFLIDTLPDRAWRIRQALEDAGLAVVTDSDLRAVVAAARILTALRDARRPTYQGSVVIAGTDELPEMGALLTAIGIRDLTFWRQVDASVFPLARVSQDADIVVDLRAGGAAGSQRPEQSNPQLVRLPALADSVAVLPGLLTALAEAPTRRLDIDVLAAVAQLLVTTVSTGSWLTTPDPVLTDTIARTARDHAAPSREVSPSGNQAG